MLLTVAVCTYRRFDYLGACLEALRRQTMPTDQFKILVVDNSLTPEKSRIFRESLPEFQNLEYLITERAGLSYARNVAMDLCETPYIAYTDDDAMVAPDWVENICAVFERYSGSAGIVGGKVVPLWEGPRAEWIQGQLEHAIGILDWGAETFIQRGDSKWLVGANVAYLTSALKRVGGFNETIGRIKDILLCHEEFLANEEILNLGYSMIFSPEIQIDHLMQADRLQPEWFCRNAYWEAVSRMLFLNPLRTQEEFQALIRQADDRYKALAEATPQLNEPEGIVERRGFFNVAAYDFMREAMGADSRQHVQDDDAKRLFHVVTPCLNAAETIDQTIQSVVSQPGDFRIRYHIQDGGSTDGTLEKLRQWEKLLSAPNPIVQCDSVVFSWRSEPDNGLYDAVSKAFDTLSTHPRTLMTWINADDIFMAGAFSAVWNARLQHPEISWVGGLTTVINDSFRIMETDNRTPTDVIREGLCDGRHWTFLQQEGMFFSKELWDQGKHALRGFRYAGDWNLWRSFAQHANYYQLDMPLAAFRKRAGQLSARFADRYDGEIDATVPVGRRLQAFEELRHKPGMSRHRLVVEFPSGDFSLEDDVQGVKSMLDFHWQKVKSRHS